MNNQLKKKLILNVPYVVAGLLGTNLGEAWRLSGGSIQGLITGGALSVAFANPLPSYNPQDLLVGACCGGLLYLAVTMKKQNAKKFRHNSEYGSARWSA